MNDQPDPRTEAQIRRALNARAEETIVSSDALDSIRGHRGSGWARAATYTAVAAAIVLIAGIALLNRPDDDPGGVDSAGTTSAAPSTTSADPYPTTGPSDDPAISIPVYDVGTANQNGLREPLPSSPAVVVAAGLELWRDADIDDAAELAAAYVSDRLGISEPVLTETNVTVGAATVDTATRTFGVHRRGENGEVRDTFAFKVVVHSDGSGPAITHVVSDAFRIDSVEHNTDDTLRVTGAGTAFEGTATVQTGDTTTLIAVGGVELDAFSAIVPSVAGETAVTVVVEGTTVFEGQVPEIAAFRTVPIPRQTTLSVFGVADDDVLNVRSGAGVDNPIVATLASDAAGLVRLGGEEFVGNERWWEIETTAGPGWANSRFLVTNPDTSLVPGLDAELAETLLPAVRDLDPVWFDSTADFGGIGVYADWPTPWTGVDREEFATVRNWSPEGTADRACNCDLTVEGFLGFDTARWDSAEYSVEEPFAPAAFDSGPDNHHFATGLFPEFGDRFVTGGIHIPAPNPDESLDWRHYTVVFDFENGSPVIRGIYRWGWTP